MLNRTGEVAGGRVGCPQIAGMGRMELFIDPGFRRLIPQLSTEERRQLEDNLLRDGRRDPVVADRTTRALVGRRDRQGRSEPKRTSRAGKTSQTV